MNDLKYLSTRIINSHLFRIEHSGVERLYFNFRRTRRGEKFSTWFEVVNDNIEAFVKTDSRFKNNDAERIRMNIYTQFREILNDCELKRKEVPLQERLIDDVIPCCSSDSAKHQADALRFLCSMKVSALYGDIGTGKSKIAIDLCQSRFIAKEIEKVIVFLPFATKRNFQEQIDMWCGCPGLEWKLVGMESIGSSGRIMLDALNYVNHKTQVIIDESHLIKNPIAKRSKRIKLICEKTSYKLVMTGTPVTENVHNLYMQYACLSELIINVRNWLKFEEKFLIVNDNHEILGYKNLEYLLSLIEPYTYQIDASVLNLPARKNLEYSCPLTFEQEYLYSCEKESLIEAMKKDEINVTDIFKTFSHMQQITSGFYKGERIGNSKIDLLKRLNLPEKCVFFTKYIAETEYIVEVLGKDNCAVFTGENASKRNNEKDDFVSGKKKYFVATMQSGGTGINGLQDVCNTVVFFSQPFSFYQYRQAIGRLERKGQKDVVTVINLRTDAKIDGRILNCLSRKGNLADEIKQLINDKTKLKHYIDECI